MVELTQKRLKDVLDYNKNTGIFIRKIASSNRCKVGDIVGSLNTDGYLTVHIDGKSYSLHRLAFLYMTGFFPENNVDHINRNRADNTWENLRSASYIENNHNRCDNTELVGVRFEKRRNKWAATTSQIDGVKQRRLGTFKYFIQAMSARFEWESMNKFVVFGKI